MVYDTLVVVAIWVTTIVIAVTIADEAVVGAWVQSLLFIEVFVFFAYFWINRGQTIGMLAWRLKLTSTESFTLRHALLRFVGALFSFACFGLGYIWIWFDRDRRSWSDMLSNTSVVRYQPTKKIDG